MGRNSSGYVGARDCTEQDIKEHDNINDVHIAVFFDGTSNNMVQQMTYKTSFANISLFEKDDVVTESEKDGVVTDRVVVQEMRRKLNFVEEEIESLMELSKSDSFMYGMLLDRIEEKSEERKALIEELKKKNAYFNVTEQQLMKDAEENGKGYSNIAILCSLFNGEDLEKGNPLTKWHKIYIEGSGTSDVSHNVAKNANGLGFGLGLTGVTALVSKAIKRTNDYLNSLSSNICQETKLHFYIFGFSRGATCSRLFSHLIVREGTKLNREDEFKAFLSDEYFIENRLAFLEQRKGVYNTDILRKNITVDFLGIYDTVASIGFLRQKDGWYDNKQLAYSWAKNYKDNWHFKNVYDYGLYISDDKNKQVNVCHICAQDEFRENFALINIGKKVPDNAVEIIIPGCHSDVGGGDMSAMEQEISLAKETEKNGKKIRTTIPLETYRKKPTKRSIVCSSNYQPIIDDFDVYPIGEESLENVAWLDDSWSEKRKKDRNTTYTVSEHNNVLYFKRNVKRGYSDISLEMMISYCKKCGIDIFLPNKIYNYKVTLKDDVVLKDDIGKAMVHIVEEEIKGKRIWFVPGGSNRSGKYKHLRLNYIHFTSSSSLMHLKNPFRNMELNAPTGGAAGNIGNKPNFDLEGMLCRIIYDGDNHNFGNEDFSVAVKYMYELGGEMKE